MNNLVDGRLPLRVALDVQFNFSDGSGGVEGVVIGLVRSLGQLQGPEQYLIIVPPADIEAWRRYTGPNQLLVERPAPPNSNQQKTEPLKRALGPLRPFAHRLKRRILPPPEPGVKQSNGHIESLGCEVVHFPTQGFVRCKLPSIYNPHDLQHRHYPEYFTPSEWAWRENVYGAGCRECHTVVVASQWVKSDVIRCYGVDTSKVQVVPFAPPATAYTEPTAEIMAGIRNKFDIEPGFALYPAMTWPHKNHIRLLEAIALLRDRDALRVRLVCTGAKLNAWPDIQQRITTLRLQDQVRFLGLVSTSELRAIFRMAEFVVVPTLFEASSCPVYDAWNEGVPVTCSTVTSLPEQVGDAAVLFDPNSVEAIAAALAKMTGNTALLSELAEKGRRRLQDFDWERTAKAYRAVYRRAAGRTLSEEDKFLLAWDWMGDPRRQLEMAN